MGIAFVTADRAFRTTSLALLALAAATGVSHAQELPPGPMRDVVEQACTRCHLATEFTTKRKTAGQWAQTVNHMIDKGAVIGDNEFDRLVDYLTQHFGAEK
ncbi:MAG: hypothetical protein RL274_2623 [Pseudomonadota bacterium]|jgi:cytochrome c5